MFADNYLFDLPTDLLEHILSMAGARPIVDGDDHHLHFMCTDCRTSYTKCGAARANSRPCRHHVRYQKQDLDYVTPSCFMIHKGNVEHRFMRRYKWNYYTAPALLYSLKNG